MCWGAGGKQEGAENVLVAPRSMLHATGHGCLCHTVSSGSQSVALRPKQLGGYGGVSIPQSLFDVSNAAFATASCASERSRSVRGPGALQAGLDGR